MNGSKDGGDVAIVGAGLIGLSLAFELALRGATVRVYDKGEPARAASWAGAGMLAPYSEAHGDAELAHLCAASLQRYDAFAARLAEASGVDARLRLDGILHVAFDEARLEALRAHAAALRETGAACDLLDRGETLAAEAWIGAGARGSLLVRGEGHVDNRRLGRALAAACLARGVSISRARDLTVECDARRVLGVRSELGFAPADAVVNACGAWAGELAGVPPHALPPVVPVKGEMLALEVPVGFVRRATWVGGAYLVPRDDGRLLVGATVERTGFDARVTAGGIESLLRAALAAAPSLGGFTISETWAGLRPGSPDGRPVLGPSALEGLYTAAGHYRNGILLAPITAELLAEAIAGGGAPPAALEPFAATRFAAGTEAGPAARTTTA